MEAFVCEVVGSGGLFDGELIHDDEEMDLGHLQTYVSHVLGHLYLQRPLQ